MSQNDEDSLIRKAQSGDSEAFSALWETITPKLFGYLVNTLRNKAVAEDVLQNTWLKAFAALPRFENRGVRFTAWLFQIARNECREHWRKSGREVELDQEKHDSAVHTDMKSNENMLAEQILYQLSEEDREILRLRYISDLSMRDIAHVLNLNFVAVRVRVHRAIARARVAHARQSI